MSRSEPQEKSSSSASEPSPSLTQLSFGDFLEKLRARGLGEKADSYLIAVSDECLKRQISQDPLAMPLTTAIKLIQNPVIPSSSDPMTEYVVELTRQINAAFPTGKFSLGGEWDNEHIGSYLREQERLR